MSSLVCFNLINTFVFLLFLISAIDGFLKTDERQRLAKERREEREKYLGKIAGGAYIIYVYVLISLSYLCDILSVLNSKRCLLLVFIACITSSKLVHAFFDFHSKVNVQNTNC